MDMTHLFNKRPILIVLAGPNGAGKSTFYETHLKALRLQFVNADVIARELGLDAYAAAKLAASIREELLRQRESFIFETVFSDPAGDKLAFFKDATELGFTVVLLFIGVSGPETSERRVSQRIVEGGHDVPADKLVTRFPRTLENLRRSIRELPFVIVFDNDDLNDPYRRVATFESGHAVELADDLPTWLREMLP
jgi:predicted ABC-type ATPase